jgi:AraC family transcriptional regulator
VNHRYRDAYPSDPLLRSLDVVRARAAELLDLEYFEAEPASMPTRTFAQHHLLLNLKDEPHRVENWRGGAHRDFTYARDEIVLTPAGLESGWRWHERSRVIVITIEPERLERFARTELGLILTKRQLRDVPQQHDPDLVQAGAGLLEALRTRATGSAVVYEALARVFLVKLLQRYGEERFAALEFSRSFTSRHFRRVLDVVEARYGGPLAIDDLAGAAGLSTAHFSRVFKEVTGDTPYQFVMDFRVEQAKRLLADRERSLSDVALACGFADQPHFTRVFRQLTGRTPKEWRTAA